MLGLKAVPVRIIPGIITRVLMLASKKALHILYSAWSHTDSNTLAKRETRNVFVLGHIPVVDSLKTLWPSVDRMVVEKCT